MAPVRVFNTLPSCLGPAPVHVLAAQGGNLLLAHAILVRVYAPLHVHGCFSVGACTRCRGGQWVQGADQLFRLSLYLVQHLPHAVPLRQAFRMPLGILAKVAHDEPLQPLALLVRACSPRRFHARPMEMRVSQASC
jgi:hypothetical protein